MQIKTIFFALFLGMANSLIAVPNPNLAVNPVESFPDDKALLLLPPPASLNIVTIGTNFIKFAWPNVPGAASFHLITKEVISGNIVSNITVVSAGPGTQTATVLLPTPGITYQAFIWSIDNYGNEGTGPTASPQVDAIIIDLVETSFPIPSGYGPNCPLPVPGGIGVNQHCTYPWMTNVDTYFKVSRNTLVKVFKVTLSPGGSITDVTADPANSNFMFTCPDGKNLFIATNLKTIAKITVAHDLGVTDGKIYRVGTTDNDANYVVERLGPNGGGGGGLRPGALERMEQYEIIPISNGFSVTPNPFSDFLTVNLPITDENQEVSINLYDLQGRRVLNQSFPGGEQMRTLPTEQIIPGLYFLHVRAGDQFESTRVLKTQ